MEFICYKKCSTCKKAEKYLEDKGLKYRVRHIDVENPTKKELKEFYKKSGLPLKRFFNTSGQLYRSLELKDRLASMSEEEQLELLSTNGMLVKRPLLVGDDFVLVGFKQAEWDAVL